MADIERNKQTVARLFDAFRAGDVEAFDDLIVEDFVQHNPQAGNGLQALKEFFAPVGPVDVDVHRVIAEGDRVVVHSNFKSWNTAGVAIYRLNDEGKIIDTGTSSSRCPRRPQAATTCSRSSPRSALKARLCTQVRRTAPANRRRLAEDAHTDPAQPRSTCYGTTDPRCGGC